MTSESLKKLKQFYLYLVSLVSLVILIIASIGLINLVLKEYVFDVKEWNEFEPYYECDENQLFYSYDSTGKQIPKYPNISTADKELKKEDCIAKVKETRESQRKNTVKTDFIFDISMLIVALPLYITHFRLARKEK